MDSVNSVGAVSNSACTNNGLAKDVPNNIDCFQKTSLDNQRTADLNVALFTSYPLVRDSAEVVKSLEKKNVEIDEQLLEVQKISASIIGRKFQFNVDEDLGLIVEIIDPVTDKVIKEIPSTESQRLRLLGRYFDSII